MAQGALWGPSGYSREPPRHPSLRINAKVPPTSPIAIEPYSSFFLPKLYFLIIPPSREWYGTDGVPAAQEPFNAEPARRDLAAAYITPVDLFFKRNHGPIPVLDDIDRFSPSAPSVVSRRCSFVHCLPCLILYSFLRRVDSQLLRDHRRHRRWAEAALAG